MGPATENWITSVGSDTGSRLRDGCEEEGKEREGKGGKGREGKEGKEREGKGRKGKQKGVRGSAVRSWGGQGVGVLFVEPDGGRTDQSEGLVPLIYPLIRPLMARPRRHRSVGIAPAEIEDEARELGLFIDHRIRD